VAISARPPCPYDKVWFGTRYDFVPDGDNTKSSGARHEWRNERSDGL